MVDRTHMIHNKTYVAQHDFNNTLFTPGFVESMHFISAADVVAICTEVVNKITRECNVRKGFETFDENKTPGLLRALDTMKRFLITDDVVKFMNWRHIMKNQRDVVLEFKHLVAAVFRQAFIYLRTSIVDISYIHEFQDIRPYEPVDWIVKYMVDKFSQGNYIFRRSGQDIEKGLSIL